MALKIHVQILRQPLSCVRNRCPASGNTSNDCDIPSIKTVCGIGKAPLLFPPRSIKTNCLFKIVAANVRRLSQAVDTLRQFFFNRKSKSLLKQFGLVIADQTVEPEAVALT